MESCEVGTLAYTFTYYCRRDELPRRRGAPLPQLITYESLQAASPRAQATSKSLSRAAVFRLSNSPRPDFPDSAFLSPTSGHGPCFSPGAKAHPEHDAKHESDPGLERRRAAGWDEQDLLPGFRVMYEPP